MHFRMLSVFGCVMFEGRTLKMLFKKAVSYKVSLAIHRGNVAKMFFFIVAWAHNTTAIWKSTLTSTYIVFS